MSDPSFENLYDKTLRFLSFRPRSEKEILDYLKNKTSFAKAADDQKEELSQTFDKILKKLKEYKFIDDLAFAKWFIENRKKGKRLILLELSHKGISKEIIEEAQSLFDLAKKDSDLLEKLIDKKWKIYQRNPEKAYEKMMGFLMRRGFDYDTVKKAIKKRLRVDEKLEE